MTGQSILRFFRARALVTGGGSGIGEATCHLLAAEGAVVTVLDRDEDAAGRVAAAVGGRAVAADVGDSEAVHRAVTDSALAMGGLTIVVNNAGVGMAKTLVDYTDKEWSLLIGVNLTGTFNMIRAAAPVIGESGGGAIVNNTSLTGLRPTRGEGPYSAAKAGVINLTQVMAKEWAASQILVNAVCPGTVDTDLVNPGNLFVDLMDAAQPDGFGGWVGREIPIGRMQTAEEVASVIAFLMSDDARYITGEAVNVSGGQMMA